VQAAARETFEETSITVDPAVLCHDLSIHQRNPGTDHARIGFAFEPREWDGDPVNAEPHKHSALVWADPTRLPPDVVGYAAAVITIVERDLTFTLNGW
jgi:8-oxo-dGTP diphosphatase